MFVSLTEYPKKRLENGKIEFLQLITTAAPLVYQKLNNTQDI